MIHMEVSWNRGTPKSSSLMVFSITHHPYQWGTTMTGRTPTLPPGTVAGGGCDLLTSCCALHAGEWRGPLLVSGDTCMHVLVCIDTTCICGVYIYTYIYVYIHIYIIYTGTPDLDRLWWIWHSLNLCSLLQHFNAGFDALHSAQAQTNDYPSRPLETLWPWTSRLKGRSFKNHRAIFRKSIAAIL